MPSRTTRFVARLLPPVVADAARWVRARVDPSPEWRYLEGGWPAPSGAAGWNVDSVAATQTATWPAFRAAVAGIAPLGVNHEAGGQKVAFVDALSAHNTVLSFGYVLARTALGKSKIAMLDWGGGVGHYALFARALVPEIPVEYHCKDFAPFVAAGRGLVPGALFYDDARHALARSYDLVLASSSLQYAEDWRATLRALAAVATTSLFVTRIPVVRRVPSFVVVQRPPVGVGYATEYPGWFFNRDELVAVAESCGMVLDRELLVGERPVVPRAPEPCEYRGFLFQPRRAAPPPEPRGEET